MEFLIFTLKALLVLFLACTFVTVMVRQIRDAILYLACGRDSLAAKRREQQLSENRELQAAIVRDFTTFIGKMSEKASQDFQKQSEALMTELRSIQADIAARSSGGTVQ